MFKICAGKLQESKCICHSICNTTIYDRYNYNDCINIIAKLQLNQLSLSFSWHPIYGVGNVEKSHVILYGGEFCA